jgi:hypothetical protein
MFLHEESPMRSRPALTDAVKKQTQSPPPPPRTLAAAELKQVTGGADTSGTPNEAHADGETLQHNETIVRDDGESRHGRSARSRKRRSTKQTLKSLAAADLQLAYGER